MARSRSGLLRWIAVFKLVKAALMVAVGVGILQVAQHHSETALDGWVTRLGLDPGRRTIDLAIGKVVSMPPTRLKELGIGSFVYAALFLVEGIGLWLGRRWAEWFTIIITGSLVPFEVYELVHKPSASKVGALVLNLAIVVYLVVRLRNEKPDNQKN